MEYIISLILALCSLGETHDYNVSMVDIYIESDHVSVEFKFERDDFYTSLFQKKVSLGTVPSDKVIQTYMDAHTSLKVNDQVIQFDLADTKIEEDHILLSFEKVDITTRVISINFFNTSLLEKFDDQIHIIHIHQKDKDLRGFQMDKDRTSISVEL